jgi:hypothetical protein
VKDSAARALCPPHRRRSTIRRAGRDEDGEESILNGLKRILGRAGIGVGLACAVAALIPTAASAGDPGRWDLVDRSTIPLVYFQGVTSAPDGDLFFDGINTGLYRSDSQLAEEARVANVIPSEVGAAESYNHVGDITYDAADGGRILLPLECYYPGTPSGANTCRTGSIGVADPESLQWQYYVKLDPESIEKVMWAEVSPDGGKLWTQQGNDLLVYDVSDISAANAAPDGPEIDPTRTLTGAVPPSGITGATFFRGRLYVAGSTAAPAGSPVDTFQVWSIDPADGSRRLEIERQVAGESEGLDVFGSLGGVLHWQIQPIPSHPADQPTTYDPGLGSLLSFVPNASADDISDSDDDGVVDATDECDQSPGGNEEDGCPGPEPDPDDVDDDGVPNLGGEDNCADVANNFQADADQDGVGDACDGDDDGDGVADSSDSCQFRANADQTDTDGDGRGNACEDDDDGDGVVDFRDNCRVVPNPAQADTDGDGVGDACEPPDPPDPDTTSPETTIGGTTVRGGKRRATIVFASSEPAGTFECRLDRRRVRRCASPEKLRHLKRGGHRFTVAARDAAGNLDASPAVARFRIKRHR